MLRLVCQERIPLDHPPPSGGIAMFVHPATQIDFRPYAGQHVLIACPAMDDAKAPARYYVLGTVAEGRLPEHVLAIIADDAYECSELMFVVLVNEQGAVHQWMPLVVFDDQGQLCYGHEVVQAIAESTKGSPCYTIWGVRV